LKIDKDLAGFETLQSISKANAFNKWMYKTIRPFLKGRVLELGSGIGNISNYILNDFTEVTLSDYNFEYCSILEKKYSTNTNLKSILSIDLEDPDFKRNNEHIKSTFDCIILLNVIEHLFNDQLSVEYCHFLLKEKGNLIILAPAHQFLYSKFDKEIGHHRRYTKRSLSDIVYKDFKVIHNQYFNFLGMAGWLLFNKFLGRKSLSENSMTIFDMLVPIAKVLDKLLNNKLGISSIVVGERK
jgi:SAM-dependent methyltransferase